MTALVSWALRWQGRGRATQRCEMLLTPVEAAQYVSACAVTHRLTPFASLREAASWGKGDSFPRVDGRLPRMPSESERRSFLGAARRRPP